MQAIVICWNEQLHPKMGSKTKQVKLKSNTISPRDNNLGYNQTSR